MGLIGRGVPMCPSSKDCWEWVRVNMKYCLCDMKDGISFSVGMVSVVSWAIAEIPQIITCYKEKSTEGVSLAFLLTWVLGDLFNIAGCLLEPATLPTQFYMALLYTATTLILTGQTIYYGYIYPSIKAKKTGSASKGHKLHKDGEVPRPRPTDEGDESLKDDTICDPGKVDTLHSSPIPVSDPMSPRLSSSLRDRYYMSARLLASSPTTRVGSHLGNRQSHTRVTPRSNVEEASLEEPLLNDFTVAQSAPPLNTKNLLCVASISAFSLLGFSLQLSARESPDTSLRKSSGIIIPIGRKLLQTVNLMELNESDGSSALGYYLGWSMAAIYMAGRLPQIWLNIQRGIVEGLNPMMFVFALIGNATYVASILVNSMEWSRIQPNLPWLVDAAVCVFLDLLILLQFIYYSRIKPESKESPRHENGV